MVQQRAQSCLAVLVALPGAGKTTLCRALSAQADGSGCRVVHVEFDQHLPASAVSPAGIFDAAAWQAARTAAMHAVAAALPAAYSGDSATGDASGGDGCGTLVLVDDNMQYRSMRQEVYRLARQRGAAFLLLYVRCTAAEAAARNAGRPVQRQVPDHVIARMAQVLEPPDGARHAWEASALVVPAADVPTERAACQRLWQQLLGLWGPPAPPAADEAAALEAQQRAQAATAASVGHQLDVRLRRVLSEAVRRAGAPGSGSAADARAGLAARLNKRRRELLAQFSTTAAAGGCGGVEGLADAVALQFERECSGMVLPQPVGALQTSLS